MMGVGMGVRARIIRGTGGGRRHRMVVRVFLWSETRGLPRLRARTVMSHCFYARRPSK